MTTHRNPALRVFHASADYRTRLERINCKTAKQLDKHFIRIAHIDMKSEKQVLHKDTTVQTILMSESILVKSSLKKTTMTVNKTINYIIY